MSTTTPDTEVGKRTLRKVSLRVMPLLMVLYFVNYLDRVNIGFAGPNGMNRELGLTATAFGFASGIFFLGYLLLEVPSNLALHRFGARRWLARILISWGIIATAMAFVGSGTWLIVLRFLLGVAEAGFFPGIILYLTYWFPAEQRARAVAMFMAAVPVSTAVGSVVSSLIISSGDGLFGLSGWRVMFLVEGIPAILLAAVTFFALTDRPGDARWLASEERAWLTERLEAEARATADRGHWPLRRALTSPRILALAFVYFGVTYGLYALGFFLPTIVAGFEQQFGTKLSVVERGAVTAIPYVVAAVAMVLWGRRADTARTVRSTAWYVAAPALVGGIAIPIALYLRSPWTAMAAVTVCAVGVCAALGPFWALPSRFLTGAAAAGGIALVNSLGNISGFAAPYITGALADVSGSQRAGLWVVGVCMVAAAAVAVAVGTRIGRERGDTDTTSVDRRAPSLD
ncbi:MFS transporter [Actinomycetospora corticicola]|uniref:MFS family permease n=1 Tax=Actinomycetospora corticicola TaxID=663602 RepID=A0A7Y9DU86_9PSEU|nr:MFS transporter [Actinomycetospora corticicola]NYD35613.1 MFS family permease [Actinomycetospora corticicola]